MGNTAIQPTPNPLPPPEVALPAVTEPQLRKRGIGYWAWKGFKVIASLKITVVLFTLAILLVFFGTLAQVDEGVWTVVNNYFRRRDFGFAWIPFQAFVRFGQVFFGVPADVEVAGRFPFPSGWQLGVLLVINLFAAHIVRFKFNWKKPGMLVLHAGVAFLMIGELVTGLFQVEAQMPIRTGESINYTLDARAGELAVINRSQRDKDDVVAVPSALLVKHQGRSRISDASLPFDIGVLDYMVNSDLQDAGKATANPATAGSGRTMVAVKRPEVSGTDSERSDVPSTYVTLYKKGTDESLGTYLVTYYLDPQPLTIDGKPYELSLRPKRTYKPYTIQLEEFRHDNYIGTNVPKNFSSRIHLTDATHHEDRQALIYMNNPLRYNGETFYQSGVLGRDEGTVLQVVYNPGWLLPYFGCVIVALGMLLHFGQYLVTFFSRRVLA